MQQGFETGLAAFLSPTAIKLRDLVIAAQAGIHSRLGLGAIGEMDPRLRRDDSLSLTYYGSVSQPEWIQIK